MKYLTLIGSTILLIILGSSTAAAQTSCEQSRIGQRVATCIARFNVNYGSINQIANTTFCNLASVMLCCIRNETIICQNAGTFPLSVYLQTLEPVQQRRIDATCNNTGQYVITGTHNLCESEVLPTRSTGYMIGPIHCLIAALVVGFCMAAKSGQW